MLVTKLKESNGKQYDVCLVFNNFLCFFAGGAQYQLQQLLFTS